MKKFLFVMQCLAVAAIFSLSSCESGDCTCTYRDNNNELREEKWDGEDLNTQECEKKESDLNNSGEDVSDVSCSMSW